MVRGTFYGHGLSDGGRVGSFERFYDAQYARVLALVYALTGDWSVAEDLTQEAFARAFAGWEQVAGYERPGAWVRTVAANLAHSRNRRRRAERRAHRRVGPFSAVEDPEPIARDLEEFWAAVRELPRQQRLAIALFYLEDLRPQEMSTILGCSASTARVHLHRARAQLQQRLDTTVLEQRK